MPMAFTRVQKKSSSGYQIQFVRGNPDCAAFYEWIHGQLTEVTKAWPPKITKLETGRKGNLGEFLSFKVARESGLYGKKNGYTVALVGALTPLQDGAPPGLDVTIVHLDPAGNESKDCLYIMEIKTTGSMKLTYATALIDDYEKLLGKTTVAGSLGQRLNWLVGYLKEVHEFDVLALERVGRLFMPDPEDCDRIKLLPTLVHDRLAGDVAASEALGDVAIKIQKQGWGLKTIEPWSIAINGLTKCFIHLSNNESSMP